MNTAADRKRAGSGVPATDTNPRALQPVPRADIAVAFDPSRPATLIGRGLNRLLGAETPRPEDVSPPLIEVPRAKIDRLLIHFATQLGGSMLEHPDIGYPNRRITLNAEQHDLALSCLYVCANAVTTPAPAAMNRLGAVTDLIANEERFWWWNALTLQVALNTVGEGNGGYRILYGNLSHPRDELRRELCHIAWLARHHLDWRRAAPALLANVERTMAHWPASLAVLRAVCGDHDQFHRVIHAYNPERYPSRFRGRIAGVDERDSALERYLAQPDDLLARELATRARVAERLILT